MTICKKCGFKNEPSAVLCGNCSVPLSYGKKRRSTSTVSSGSQDPSTTYTQPLEMLLTAVLAGVMLFWSLSCNDNSYQNSADFMVFLIPFGLICGFAVSHGDLSPLSIFDWEGLQKTPLIMGSAVWLVITAFIAAISWESNAELGYNEAFVISTAYFGFIWAPIYAVALFTVKSDEIKRSLLDTYAMFLGMLPFAWLGGLFLIAMMEGG